MTEPVIAQKAPYAVMLQPGTYWWCACGRSKTQPFCDGSHDSRDGGGRAASGTAADKDTGITPVKFELQEAKQVYFCGCKRSKTKPLCDGTHKTL